MDKNVMRAILSIGGMTLFWPFFRREFSRLFLVYGASGVDSGSAAYVVFLAVLTVLIVATIALRKRVMPLIRQRTAMVVVAAFASLGSIAAVGAPHVEHLFWPMMAFASLALSAWFVLMCLAWADFFSSVGGRRALILLCVSFACSNLVSLVSPLPFPYPFIVPVAAPLVSALCWYGCRYAPVAVQDGPSSQLREFPLGFMGVLVFSLMVSSVMRGLLHLETSSAIYVQSLYVTMVLITFVIASMILLSTKFEKLCYLIWICASVVLITGIFLANIPDRAWFQIASGVIVAGRTCLSFLLFVILVIVANQKKRSLALAVGLFFLVPYVVSECLSYVVVPSIAQRFPFVWDDATVLAAIVLFVLVMGVLLFMFSLVMRHSTVGNDPDSADAANPYHDLAQRYGLTAREEEIFRYIAQGYSAKKVASLLYVSTNTVQTHTKNLYRKFDVHSRQELIDIVNEGTVPPRL